MTTTTTKTRRQRNEAIFARALTAQFTGRQFTVDAKGRTLRTDRATDDEIRTFLIGNRVVSQCDIMAELGNAAFEALVATGCLVRDPSFNRYKSDNLYWVTERAQERYDLPRKIKIACGAEVGYAPAPKSVN
jgi:hypothetical protein